MYFPVIYPTLSREPYSLEGSETEKPPSSSSSLSNSDSKLLSLNFGEENEAGTIFSFGVGGTLPSSIVSSRKVDGTRGGSIMQSQERA